MLAFGISRNATTDVQAITLGKRKVKILDILDQEISRLKSSKKWRNVSI